MSFIASSNQKLLQLSNPTKYRESPTLTKKSDRLRTGIPEFLHRCNDDTDEAFHTGDYLFI